MPSRGTSEELKELSRKKAWEREHVRYPFWFGGSASCFAACVTHPLDLGGFLQIPEILFYCANKVAVKV
jgi:hypothetical protein